MKRIIAILLALLTLCALAACRKNETTNVPVLDPVTDDTDTNYELSQEPTAYVCLTIKDMGEIVIELLPEYAPATVANFQKLVGEGFYNGLTFHRIYAGFMIQGGDPLGNGTGQSDEAIPGEFAANGFEQNTLSHTRGVVSMARRTDPDSASCQFFIVLEDSASRSLDGRYAAFGRVVKGMDVVDAIAALPVTRQVLSEEVTKPIDAPVIESAVFVAPAA